MALPIKDIKKLVAIMEKGNLAELTCGEIHLVRRAPQAALINTVVQPMSQSEVQVQAEPSFEPDELDRLLYNLGTELHG